MFNPKQFLKSLNLPYAILEEPYRIFPYDRIKLARLKNAYQGKRCFIIGNGPSLNKIDLRKLDNEYSFGVNGIFYKTDELGFRPSFYVVEDKHVLGDNLEIINDYRAAIRFFPSHYRRLIKNHENTIFFNANRGFYEERSPYFGLPRFSTDCARRIYFGQSVTMVNLQLAFYLGFQEVYLIGMDFSYVIPESAKFEGLEITSTEDDSNHFHPAYFGKGKKWHDPQLEKTLLNYKLAKLMFEASDRKIYNATVGGKLEAFERVDFESLF